jgi:hypothetical protein
MTNIDWTKPVETTEDPPRPVQVLFDADGRPKAAHIDDNPAHSSFNLFTIERGANATRGMYSIPLRNVEPPKPEPVLREAWINLYPRGLDGTFGSKAFADEQADDRTRIECRRIAWMSDGSLVPGGDDQNTIKTLTAERDNALVEVSRITKDFNDLAEGTQQIVEKLEAERDILRAEIARMHPVVEAAVTGVDIFSRRGLLRLIQAVRIYQQSTKKSAEQAVEKHCGNCLHTQPGACAKNGPSGFDYDDNCADWDAKK